MAMIRIFIADDHALVRDGLCRVLRGEAEFEVTGQASNVPDLLQKLRGHPIDVCIVDLSRPGNEGVEVVKQVLRTGSVGAVLVLSMHEDGVLAARAIKAGAAGYLTKDVEMDILVMAVRRLANKGRFIDPKLVDKLVFDSVQVDNQPLHALLSDREYEIFQYLVAGHSVTEVAKILHISAKTVSTYKVRLMQKMNIESVADLVRYAVKNLP